MDALRGVLTRWAPVWGSSCRDQADSVTLTGRERWAGSTGNYNESLSRYTNRLCHRCGEPSDDLVEKLHTVAVGVGDLLTELEVAGHRRLGWSILSQWLGRRVPRSALGTGQVALWHGPTSAMVVMVSKFPTWAASQLAPGREVLGASHKRAQGAFRGLRVMAFHPT